MIENGQVAFKIPMKSNLIAEDYYEYGDYEDPHPPCFQGISIRDKDGAEVLYAYPEDGYDEYASWCIEFGDDYSLRVDHAEIFAEAFIVVQAAVKAQIEIWEKQGPVNPPIMGIDYD